MAYRPKILVVEHDAATLRQIEATLRVMGATPRSLGSSRQAAKLVNQDKFDGAFLDWDVPEVSGEQLTKLIRASKSNKTIPIAMLTARPDAKCVAEGFRAGVTFFLNKPVGAKEITRLLNATRGAMLKERRRYERVPLRATVQCRWGGKAQAGHSVNLSASGMLLILPNLPEAGAQVELDFQLPKSRRPLQLSAKVIRVVPGNQMAVQFRGLSPEERELLESHVALSEGGLGSF